MTAHDSTGTGLEARCNILGSLWLFYRDTDDGAWADFFEWGDIGLPLAYMVWQGMAVATEDGEQSINEVWAVVCEMVDVDPEGTYADLSAFFEASPNPPLSEVDND